MSLAPGQTTLGTIRITVRQRSDMVNSQFITDAEFNSYINSSYQELYGLITQKFGNDYFTQSPSSGYSFVTDGINDHYALPSDFFKLLGVDVVLAQTAGSNITLRPFTFGERNRYSIPNFQTWFGVTNLKYRLNGNQLWLIPLPSANQTIKVFYVPRWTLLVNDTDVLDGVNGWEEYVVADVVIKAKSKEESDCSVEVALKSALMQRIESEAEDRDAGSPQTVSDVQWSNISWPGVGSGYGPGGGY